jgi:hypothetical protein
MKGLGWKHRFILWSRAFNDLRRASTSEVVWSKVVHLNGCRVLFQLERKSDRSWISLTFDSASTAACRIDLGELQRIEAALVATKSLLDPSQLEELVREKENELERLQFVARLWRRFNDPHLWRKVVPIGLYNRICFRIERNKHTYIDFHCGEDGAILPVGLHDLETLEEGLLAAMAQSGLSTEPHRDVQARGVPL